MRIFRDAAGDIRMELSAKELSAEISKAVKLALEENEIALPPHPCRFSDEDVVWIHWMKSGIGKFLAAIGCGVLLGLGTVLWWLIQRILETWQLAKGG